MKTKMLILLLVTAGLLSVHAFATTISLDGTWYTGSNNGTPSLSDPNSSSFTWGTPGGTETAASVGTLWSYFTDQPLAEDGDSFTLSFTVVPGDANAVSGNFRFGLFDSNDLQVLTNLSSTYSDDGFLDTLGYFSIWDQGTSGNAAKLYARTTGKTLPTTTTDSELIAQDAVSQTLQQGVPYDMTFTVTRYSADECGITATINSSAISAMNTTLSLASLDMVAFLNQSNIESMEFANLQVTTEKVPLITGPPEDTGVLAGDPASMTVVAVNPNTDDATGLSYQWYHVHSGTMDPVGTDSETYTIPSVAVADEGSYYCIVTLTGGGQTISQSAVLKVNRLLAHYEFDGDATDATGVYDGTAFGGPTYTTGGGGVIGEAIVLDGVDDKVEYTFPEETVIPEFSLTFWVQTSLPNQSVYTSLFNNGDGASAYNFQINTSGDGDYDYTGGTSGGTFGAAGIDTWILLGVTYDGTTTRLYADGGLVDSAGGPHNHFDRFCVGVNRGDSAFFQGIIDDVRVYNYALTNTEMGLLYTDVMGGEVCTEPPVYDLNDDCKTDLQDFAIFAATWAECGLVPAEACN